MTTLHWLIASAVYVAGFGFTVGATGKLGEHNPRTRGDSFTGSSACDLWVWVLWPVTWLAWIPCRLGKKI